VRFVPVRHMREVLDVALVTPIDWKSNVSGRTTKTKAPRVVGPTPAHASKND